MDYNEAMELINHVFYHAITCHEPYEHQYTKGDILVWDNFSLLHAATHKLPTTDARHGERSEGAYSAVGSDFLPSVSDCKKSLRAVKSFESPCVVEP
ncbi:TauD/TfdA family dioxygenase [Candidiatus Paracoxiella cheracis]|uniref:TauD/TfdA family dioxygenase n=1 Tax=Candidiatus Paracoxiella cheracis TaxID=3405120 RepID=UPI003BF577B0